jgi:hypothetical protein
MDSLGIFFLGFLLLLCVLLLGVFVTLTKGPSRRSLRSAAYSGPRDGSFKKVHW